MASSSSSSSPVSKNSRVRRSGSKKTGRAGGFTAAGLDPPPGAELKGTQAGVGKEGGRGDL
ncbi:hypothetical protein E2C01_101629 [Portunus trituberculatus]|uniref:Uncharacterized protein n=1 Tax=Portunus trituberculatus TaxID=210409 RepID=A0A5B7KFC8_PORTR|nr:hypothetical protein [Portunus trituberculatus]